MTDVHLGVPGVTVNVGEVVQPYTYSMYTSWEDYKTYFPTGVVQFDIAFKGVATEDDEYVDSEVYNSMLVTEGYTVSSKVGGITLSALADGTYSFRFHSTKQAKIIDFIFTVTGGGSSVTTYNGTCGTNLTWTLDDDTGVLTVSGTGAMTDFTSSSSSIPWNLYRPSIKSIVVGDNVSTIGDFAFSFCTALTSVIIPDSVETIGESAFQACTALTSVIIPDSVTSIGYDAFIKCTSLTSVTIGESVTSIGDYAFESNTNLATVYNASDLTLTQGSTDNGYVAYYATNVYNKGDLMYIAELNGSPIQVASAVRDENGKKIASTYATKTQLTNGSVTKVGTATVGSTSKPIYLNAGSPAALSATVGSATQPVYLNGGTVTKCTYTLGASVPSGAKFTDTTYSTATTSSNGLMSSSDKSKLDGITASADTVSFTRNLSSGTKIGTITINGTGTDLYCQTNTDTHYASKNVVGSTSATSNTTSALTNGKVYLNCVENGAVTSTHKISGSGATTVTTDASGNIVISSTDTNTNTDTKNTTGSTNSTSKLFLVGATSQAANPVTYSNSSVYETNGALNAASLTLSGNLTAKGNTVLGDAAADTCKITGATTITGNLTVSGNITQSGSTYITDAQEVHTTNDYIKMRDGATGGLASGAYSGLEFVKYDGTNNGRLVVDNSGTARVGDSGSEQPLLTRSESSAMSDGQILTWDGTNLKAVTGGYTIKTSVPSGAVFTDTKCTAVGNHYTPTKSTTKSASGGTSVDITGNATNVITGIEMDAKGHVTGVVSSALKSTNTNTDTKVAQALNESSTSTYAMLYSPYLSNNTGSTGTSTAYRTNKVYIQPSTGALTATKFVGNVTGNCSGSSGSCTGNAATATKLTTGTTGSATAPVYFSGGKPIACPYELTNVGRPDTWED